MAFSIMLTRTALEFYFTSLKNKHKSLADYTAKMQKRFETPKRARYLYQRCFCIIL